MKKGLLPSAILACLLVFTFFVYAQDIGESGKAPSSAGQTEEQGRPNFKEKRFVATIGQDGVQHVEITGGEYYFDPNYIVVKINVPVELKVKKTGYVPHDITVRAPEAGINFTVDMKKEPAPILFTPTKAGIYEMDCEEKLLFFKSHKDRGMYGFIEVVP